MSIEQSPLRTQGEAARFLRVSERTLERWRVEGTGPRFRKIGKRVVYHDQDLASYVDARAFSSTAEAEA